MQPTYKFSEDTFTQIKMKARELGKMLARRKPPAIQAITLRVSGDGTSGDVNVGALPSKITMRIGDMIIAAVDENKKLVTSPFISEYRREALVREYTKGLEGA